jgi:lipoprotein-releasing system ATP-binding protein
LSERLILCYLPLWIIRYFRSMLEARDLTKRYGNLHVLRGVSMNIAAGELVSIVGSSGAGKSTLLHLLGTLDTPDTGTITLKGRRIDALNARELARFRNRHIGFVFQFHHLLPEFTAWENVCVPGWIAGDRPDALKKRALDLLDRLGVSARAEHKPNALSGGEQQRVAVARALINQPDIILADEPTGNLDSKHAHELHELFLRLSREFNQTFLVVTHNEALAAQSDRVLYMRDGLMVESKD